MRRGGRIGASGAQGAAAGHTNPVLSDQETAVHQEDRCIDDRQAVGETPGMGRKLDRRAKRRKGDDRRRRGCGAAGDLSLDGSGLVLGKDGGACHRRRRALRHAAGPGAIAAGAMRVAGGWRRRGLHLAEGEAAGGEQEPDDVLHGMENG